MPTSHLIKQGDTLSGIAATYKTDVATLAKLNNIADPNKIQAGASINLPAAPKPSLLDNLKPPAGIATSDPITNAENLKKAEQIKADNEAQQELVRLQTQKQLTDLKATLAPSGGAPTKPDLLGTYSTLRDSQGVSGVETEIADIRKEKLALREELKKFEGAAHGQGTQASLVDTQVNEKAQKLQQRMEELNTTESLAVDRLNAKNKYIETVMNLTEKDFQFATAQYDKEYAKNLQIQSQLATDVNRVRDDARAYLTTVSNFVQNSGKEFDTLDPGMQAEIHRQELKAGFPVGTLEAFVRMKPKANLLGTKDGVDANGNAVISYIYADEQGNPGVVRTVPLPGVKGTGTNATTEAKKEAFKKAQPYLEKAKGSDGFVDPAIYSALRTDFAQAIGDPSAFDETFSLFLSPQERARLGVGKAAGVKASDGGDALF